MVICVERDTDLRMAQLMPVLSKLTGRRITTNGTSAADHCDSVDVHFRQSQTTACAAHANIPPHCSHLEHSNSRFESIRFDSLCESIRLVKKIGLSIH